MGKWAKKSAGTDAGPPGFRPVLVSTGLILAVLIVYAPVVGNGFVSYDDPKYVTENPWVSNGLTAGGLAWAFTAFYDGNWFPLTWISLMADSHLYGLQPAGFHFTSLFIHAVNSVLVFLLFRSMTGRSGRSLFVGVLFAMHPLHVEAVAWIAERKEVLSSLFGLLAVGSHVRYAARPGPVRMVPVCLFAAMALMAKPMWVTLPFLLLLLDYWPLQRFEDLRLRPVSTGPARFPSGRTKILILEKLPLFLFSGAACVWTYTAQAQAGAVRPLAGLPVAARISNSLYAYAAYVGRTFWPLDLSVHYPYVRRSLFSIEAIGAALLLGAATLCFVRWGRRFPYLPVGWFWFLGTLVPVIGFVQVGGQAMADRYTYLPLTGLFLMVAWGGFELHRRFFTRRIGIFAVAVGVSAFLAVGTRMQLPHWQSSLALFQRALAVSGESHTVLINLGNAHTDLGRYDEAGRFFLRLLEKDPGNADALYNLANTRARQQKTGEAVSLYRRLLRVSPGYPGARNNLGSLMAEQGRYTEALALYQEALGARPDDPEIHGNLATLLYILQRYPEAERHFKQSLAADPENAAAHLGFAAMLEALGRHKEAVFHLAEVIRIRPEHADAYRRLGRIFQKAGHADAARQYLHRAAEIDSSTKGQT